MNSPLHSSTPSFTSLPPPLFPPTLLSMLIPNTFPSTTHLHHSFLLVQGFQYKMRAVYAHFPINCVISNNNKTVEIRNFLGEKYIRKVEMAPGVTIAASAKMKDEFVIEGNNVEAVSQTCKYSVVVMVNLITLFVCLVFNVMSTLEFELFKCYDYT